MNSMSKFLIFLFAGICATTAFTACSSKGGGGNVPPTQTTNGITRRSFLNDQQIVSNTPPVSSATATATVTLNPATGNLSGTVTLSNFTAAATAVTINEGDIGANGSPVVSLTETPAGSGIWTIPQTTTALTATQKDSFKAAGYHIIVETSANPNGEIRGQLISYADNIQPIFDQNCVSCHSASGAASATGLLLDAAQSYSRLVSQPATQSPGTRVVPFDTSSSVLIKRIQGTLPALTRMPPAGPLAPPDANLIRVWVMMGAINDSDVFPVPPPPRTLFTRRALLESRQVVAAIPVVSSATGTAAMVLDTTTNKLIGTVNLSVAAITATAVHINDGDVGSSGAPVVSLSETPAGSGIWTVPSTVLTPAQADRFKNAGLYVSVDTAANPNGEIRGQLLSYGDNVQPIFDTNCTNCHFALGPASFTGLLLLSANSYTSLVNQPAAQSTGARVIPSDANNSVLMQRITGTGPASVVGSQMPPPESHLPALAQRDQDLIKTWINMGAIDDGGTVRTPVLLPARQFIRNSVLNAQQVAPTPTTSTATVTATIALSDVLSRLSGTIVISGTTNSIISVSIKDGDAGSNGGSVDSFFPDFANPGVYFIPQSGPLATTLTTTQMNRFIAGGLYISVVTKSPISPVSSEEIRGQLQTFKDDVQPIFTARCVKCHSTGMVLTKGQAVASLVNVTATSAAGTRVIPGDAANSVLYTSITTGIPAGRMPLDGPPFLTSRETSIIKAWIVMGAPND